MRHPKPTTVDVETFAIEGRPAYPPIPVGVAIKEWGKKARYLGFGHVEPEDGRLTNYKWNNSSGEEALFALKKAYANPDGVLFHNCKFDLDVIETHFGLAPPPMSRVHDTMFLLFLNNPNSRQIGLKPAAEELLGLPAEERDELNDWLTTNQPVPGVKISTSLKGKHPPGAYIAYAPTQIVGPYAIGDVERTEALFWMLHKRIVEADMLAAYDRERRLLPVLLDMERRGVAVDMEALKADIQAYNNIVHRLEAWVRSKLDCDPQVNLESGTQLLDALERAELVDISKLGVTKKGARSSDKAAIKASVLDPQLAATLQYLAQLRTCLHTFMEPWYETAKKSGGLIYTQWHQTRGGGGGARTGRLSSSPNFQNIPVEFDPLFSSGSDQLPKAPINGLRPLPLCRRYITAYKGQVLAGRDFNGQELRILAHFEDGDMLQSYKEKPDIDFHQHAADLITETTGINLIRRDAKTLNFTTLYGGGIPKLALKLNCTVVEAKTFLDAYYRTFPGIKRLQEALKFRARQKQHVTTTGGRRYFCEEPAIVDGQMRTFEYKMTNTIVQASAADQTKEAMIRFYEIAGPGWLILSVHDELVASVPRKERKEFMAMLCAAMDVPGLDAPILTDGETGHSWSEMEALSRREERYIIDLAASHGGTLGKRSDFNA